MVKFMSSLKISIARFAMALFHRHPFSYKVLALSVSVWGYIILLSAPACAFMGGYILWRQCAVGGLMTITQELSIVTGMGVVAAGWISFRLLRVTYAKPDGINIDANSHPELFHLIYETVGIYNARPVDRVILNCTDKIELIRTPAWIIPFCYHTTLAIGLPVLVGHTTRTFACLLTHRIAQYTGKYNREIEFITQMSKTWIKLGVLLKKYQAADYAVLATIINAYASINQALADPAIKQNELLADTASLELISRADMAQAIAMDFINRQFMKLYFWSKVRHHPTRFSLLDVAAVRHKALTEEKKIQWLNDLFQLPNRPFQRPTLRSRLQNLGFAQIIELRHQADNAATLFLAPKPNDTIAQVDQFRLKLQSRKHRGGRTNTDKAIVRHRHHGVA